MAGSDYQESMINKAKAESESNSERSENEENWTFSDNDEMIGVSVKSKELFMASTLPNKGPNDLCIKPRHEYIILKKRAYHQMIETI